MSQSFSVSDLSDLVESTRARGEQVDVVLVPMSSILPMEGEGMDLGAFSKTCSALGEAGRKLSVRVLIADQSNPVKKPTATTRAALDAADIAEAADAALKPPVRPRSPGRGI